MRASAGRVVIVAVACLVWVTGCETSTKLTGLFSGPGSDPATATTDDAAAPAASADSGATGTVASAPVDGSTPTLLGRDPNDDLNLGKKYFRAANFGLAEKHFRRAIELHPRDAESWMGLAASYDRLRRFELADRSYGQAARIIGETPELMNNKGFSYMLRGDYRRARNTLSAAQASAPNNPYIRNNLQLLEKSERRSKAIN